MVNRREFLATVAAAQGAFVLGFWMPQKADAQTVPGAVWYEEPATPEINAWIVIAPDDTVTIRIAQTELGQGVWTSNAMMVCEELQCDWTKVRPQYASANRDAREKAPAWTLNVMGQGATDPKGGGEPGFGNRDRTGVAGIPDSLYRRMRTNAASSVKDGRYYLQLAGAEARERLLLAAAALWNVPVAELTAKEQHHHARVERPHHDLRPDRPACRRDAASASGDDHHQVAGPMDADGHRAEKPRRAAQGDRSNGVRDRRPRPRHEMGGREGVSRLWRRRQELRLRRDSHAARRALRRAVPDSGSRADPRPRLQRRRRRHRRHLVPGQDRARSDADRMEHSPEHAAVTTASMHASLLAALDRPGNVRVNQGDVDAAFARAAKIVEATYSTPYLARARMEPGNATVLVTGDRVDIWIGDQSPQETRFSAAKITGIPEQNVHLHMCHLGGGFGRNGNGPQAEQAIMIANANRGIPIHMLWTREEDFIGTTYRAMGVARLKAGLDADGWPIALDVRTSMQEGGFGPDASFDVISRYHVPNYRYSFHTTKFHVPVGTRRGVGQAAHEFYRESFMDELARAAGKDPYRYRRELLARTNLPYKNDMIKALDMAAEMSGWGTPLPRGKARAIGLEERGAEGNGMATISAMVHTVSVSREGKVRLERVDVAHDTGFGLVNPLSVKKQIEGQITWFYNDAMHQATTIADGHIVENNFHTFPLSRIDEDPPEINIRFFPTGHWLIGMGHDRATSVQSAIGDAIFQITGKRFRDLPYSRHDLSFSSSYLRARARPTPPPA